MATIAGPRPIHPQHVSAFVALTPSRSNRPLKRSPCKQVKQGTNEATPSLRDIYLASSEQALQAAKGCSQALVLQDIDHSTVSENHMARFSGYKRLSSGPLSPAPVNTSIAANIPAMGQEVVLTDTQSSLIQGSTTSLKAACEKPLPPEPALCPQGSPERCGVMDTQDSIMNSLNDRYPPLAPASSPDTNQSDQQSPAPSSFHIAASLLSGDQSRNSISPGEYGVANAITIQSIPKNHFGNSTEHPYVLKAPRSSKIPRLSSRSQIGQPTNGSPSRSPSFGSKVNRSMLRGRQALSARGRQSLSMMNSQREDQGAIQQEDIRDGLSLTPISSGSLQPSKLKNSLEEFSANGGTQRTSLKYGYSIRESLDARETIMGQLGSTAGRPNLTPLHPPRTSSLPQSPSPCAIDSASSAKSPSTSHISRLYRQTAASSARASFNAKKISERQPSMSRISQSRTLASFGDVSKGMKNLGKKVSKIMPHRRSVPIEASSGSLTINSEKNRGPRRQASLLLTTYNNSGMEDGVKENFYRSDTIGDNFPELEPVDRHEQDGTEKDKEIWHQGSRNRVYHAETGRYIRFGLQYAGSDDEDEERRHPRRGTQAVPDGHYVEDGVEDDAATEHEGVTNNLTNPSSEEDENARVTELPPTRRVSVESNVTAVGAETPVAPAGVDGNSAAHSQAPDANFDQMLRETDARARDLLSFATGLDESPLRSLMIEGATHLAEGLMRTRQARINLIRSNQALDEATILLAANAHRMSVILQEVSAARPA